MVSVHAALPRRLLALWLTGVYVFALVGSFVHRVAVEHVPCADHGEFVHAPDADAGDERQRGGDEGDHEHDHCVLAALAQAVACPSEAPQLHGAPWPPRLITAVALPAIEVVRAEADRYRLAPKGSPPPMI